MRPPCVYPNKPKNKEIIMVINHNMSAMFAQRSQGIQDLNAQKSM